MGGGEEAAALADWARKEARMERGAENGSDLYASKMDRIADLLHVNGLWGVLIQCAKERGHKRAPDESEFDFLQRLIARQ